MSPTCPSLPSEYIAKLSQDYHINALQYYDWQYRHDQPVATGDFAEKWPLWYDNTYAAKKTVADYETAASKTGTATGINLPDGAGTDKIGPSSASYIYTELWDHNETNQQVASYLQGARDKSANKPQIVAAYANNYDPASWVADPSDSNKQIHPQVTPDEGTRIEAESDQARVSGDVTIVSGDASASGGSYASGIAKDGDAVTFNR